MQVLFIIYFWETKEKKRNSLNPGKVLASGEWWSLIKTPQGLVEMFIQPFFQNAF